MALFALTASAVAAPRVPVNDDEVLERVREGVFDSRPRELAAVRAELKQNPKDLNVAIKAARRYIEQARLDSDPRYLGYAEAALAPWWNSPEPPAGVLVLRATIRQSNHDFDSALDDLALALKRDPANAQAWLTRATILQVLGKYEEALQSCEALRGLAPEAIVVSCTANAASLNGRARESYDALARAFDSSLPQSQTAWLAVSLAEIAERLGEHEKAEAHYRAALKSGDAYARGAYADFLLDRKRFDEVVALLKDETRADGLLLRLAIAESALGSANAKQHVDALSSRFAASRMRGDKVHLREDARFTLRLLNKPNEALKLAQENWETQREPADARILLEAAAAANDREAALPVVEWLKDARLEDVRIRELIARL